MVLTEERSVVASADVTGVTLSDARRLRRRCQPTRGRRRTKRKRPAGPGLSGGRNFDLRKPRCHRQADAGARRLAYEDIKVVAPFNSHVRCLGEKLPAGVQVGTVDKFHGQQCVAEVVEATRYVESGRKTGNVVLRVSEAAGREQRQPPPSTKWKCRRNGGHTRTPRSQRRRTSW